ncbi:MAG: hypothetical protein LBQ67_07795 [Treponema sp.]|jgi:hypothetical protein|nr:hypothetical protein [Treponema sp.]
MNRKKCFMAFFVTLFVFSALYAQSNANLKPGVYRVSGMQGAGSVIIRGASSRTTKSITVHAVDGSVAAHGTARISGSRVNVDYGDKGFETWTIIDEETFTDDNFGATWRWVRNYRNDEL